MKKQSILVAFLSILLFLTGCINNDSRNLQDYNENNMSTPIANKINDNGKIILPQPKTTSSVSLEEAILKRRSRRDFLDKPLTLDQISQILWAAQGITDKESGFRSTPSAGALYPLELFLVVSRTGLESLDAGVYHYSPEDHSISKTGEDDLLVNLADAALSQEWIRKAPVNIIITAVFSKTTQKYGERGKNYVYIEAGHVAQNIALQVESLSLGTVTVGAFDDDGVKQLLGLSEETPLYIMPVGYSK